jgi:serine/threonine protein phosphatase PrpC
MEDAHLALSPLNGGKNSLFAVFDGHGGISFFIIQALKFLNSYKDTLYNSYSQTLTIKKQTMN